MGRRGDVARAVAAVVVLAAALVGLPALLVLGVGWPLPTAVPRLSHLADTVTAHRPLETATVWKVLAVALWFAWAQVLVAVVVEMVALSRGALPRALPGLGLGHGLAAPLVAAIVVAWPAGGTPRTAAMPAPAAVARPLPPEVAAAAEPEPPSASPPPASPIPAPAVGATVDHVVQRRDNLWDLAERYLGDGHRASELFDLNRGRPQADGEAFTDPGLLRPGWVLRVPAPASTPSTSGAEVAGPHVTVQPGDTLWDLADEHLGDGHRYHDLVALNAGRPQPDGGALTRADLIEPGWVLELPQPAPLAPSPQHQAPAAGVVSAEPSPSGTPGEAELPAPSPAPTSASTQEQAPLADGAATRPAIAEPPNQPAGEAPAEDDDDDVAQPVGPVGLLAGGVGTAGLVVLLNRRRRAQQRRRPRGLRVPQPEAPLVEAERALRAGTDMEASVLLEAALRAAAVGSEGGLPPLRWVDAAADMVTLVVDSDSPAPPGFADDGPGRWRASASAAELDGVGQAAASPVPALVAVGATEAGSDVLIDLEANAVTSVVGDAASTEPLLRTAAVAAATSPWRDHARIVTVGVGGRELPDLVDVESVQCLDDALDELERRAEAVADALASLGCAGTAQARAGGITSDAWTPLVVIATAPAEEHQLRRLTALAQRRSSGIAVLTVAPAPSQVVGRMIEVDANGCLRIEGADLVLRARRLDVDDVAVVGELLSGTEEAAAAPNAFEEPPPRTPLPAPVAIGASALEALLSEVDVVVRVLGPVEAVRLSADGEQRLAVPKQKSLEAIAYLALREGHVDRDDLQAALWPAGANSAKTFHNTIWGARKALGIDRDGAEAFPEPAGGLYWLSRRVVTDYGLFHELVSRAEELDDAQAAAALLAEALTLVQGEPFVGLGRGYCWVAPHAGIIVAQVVDAAQELAETRLAAGDWRAAEWAARQGLRVFPCEERLYRLLMRCAHAAGSASGVHRVFQEMTAKLADPDDGVEPEDTVHPDTVALLDQLAARHSPPSRASA